MKESIFFNREQLKLIRWYGILYQLCFKYGVRISSFLLSLLAVWCIFATGYVDNIFLLESISDAGSHKVVASSYLKKQQSIRSISGLDFKIINWKLSFSSGVVFSQSNLLSVSGVVLPNIVQFGSEESEFFSRLLTKSKVDKSDLYRFFTTVLVKPLGVALGVEQSVFADLTGTLENTFGLNCLKWVTKYSFVCNSYVQNFLDNFYYYNLGTNQEIEELGNNSEIAMGALNSSFYTKQELIDLFQMIKLDRKNREAFCEGLLHYGEYWWVLDDSFSDIFRSCGSSKYAQFVLLRDFSEISRLLAVGYSDTRVYGDALLNQYKLFSLQQLLYKQLTSSADVKSLMQSYLWFLREILVKEGTKKKNLLWIFPKTFTHWYNINIISPYLKDEKSRMEKEDRTSFMNQLFAIHYGDKVSNFIGLNEQVGAIEDSVSNTGNMTEQTQDLEKLFRSSYLPAQFTLISVQKTSDPNKLIVKGVDRKTNFTVEVKLKYENIQLFVEEVKIVDNQKLTEYLQALIVNDTISLIKLLSLMDENKEIAQQTQLLDQNVCVLLKDKYKKELVSCSDKEVKIRIGSGEKLKDGTMKNPLTYTFSLTKGKLTNLQISDKVLETKVLKEIDFSLIDATTTYYMITSLVGYIPQEKDSGFWMKEQVLVNDKFVKYFGISPDSVSPEGGDVKVYFTVGKVKFIGNYDIVTNELNPISLDFGTARRPVLIQNFSLTLRDDQSEVLNAFVLDPLESLRKINTALVKKYFPEEKAE